MPRTTQRGHAEPIAPMRLAEAPKPTAPNQVWVSEITYVRTAAGWLYVAAFLDRSNRRIVGWASGASLAAELVLAALAMARQHRRPPARLLSHSDRGVQYGCGDFRAALAGAQFVASMSSKGNCSDNATMESFWSSFKRARAKEIHPTRRDGSATAFADIETFYNRVRLHGALGYRSPCGLRKPTQLINQHPPPRVSTIPGQAHRETCPAARQAMCLEHLSRCTIPSPTKSS